MKHLVKSSVVAIVLFGSTLSAFAGVTGGDPRPQVIRVQGVTGGDPRPQLVSRPVGILYVILPLLGM